MPQGQVCEYCGRQPLFICAQCKWTAYCSRQHQLQHWRIHKQHCNIVNSYRLREQQQQTNKKRSELRKKYFQSFMHKIFDGCIKSTQQMVQLQQKHIKTTREIFNQMEYGISICLLARSWINVRNEAKALILIQKYLEEKIHFLKDMRDITNFQSLQKQLQNYQKQFQSHQETLTIKPQLDKSYQQQDPSTQIPQISQHLLFTISIIKQFAIKKVSLIASVANILHYLREPVTYLYQIYTHHIQKMFGRDSYETSNCYFMMGSYFMEKHQYNKSIACFMKASELRGSMAGDCYYNLGIIYHLLRKPQVSLMMFENAAKLRQNQFSQNSSQVADVYHNLALINQSLGDYKSAIQNLQKIALIYSKDKSSPQYKNAKQSIKILESGFRKHMQKTPNLNSALMNDMKKVIRKTMKQQDDALSEQSMKQDKQFENFKDNLGSGQVYMRINQQLVNKLNPLEAFYLSQLQIQLSKCQSMYMAATTVGSSHFIRVLMLSKLEELIKENQVLFKNVSIQKLSKRGIKENPQLD